MRRLLGITLLASSSATLGCGAARDDAPAASANGAGRMPEASGGSSREQASAGVANGGLGGTSTAGRDSAPSGGAAASASAGGDGNGAGQGSAADDIETILQTYRSYAPLSPEPVAVSGYIFNLCRLPTLPETEFLASIHGDGRYLRDWANSQAQAGLKTRGSPAFAAGAVIVKEKYAGHAAADADLVALGIMIKRDAGFDAPRGDWEYAYYEPGTGVVRSAEQSTHCATCHAGASATDYVFVDGLQP